MPAKLKNCLSLAPRISTPVKLHLRVRARALEQTGGMTSKAAEKAAVKELIEASEREEAALREGLADPEAGAFHAAEPAPSYHDRIPPDKIEQAMTVFAKLAAKSNTLEKFAESLFKIGPKATRFSHQVWFFARGAGATGPAEPDWAGIYAKLEAAAQPQKPKSPSLEGFVPTPGNVTNLVRDSLLAGDTLTRRWLNEIVGGMSTKAIDEAAELGIVLAAKAEVAKGGTEQEIFDRLQDLHRRQPNLTAKTSTSKINNAYSTPMPMAYLASRLADISKDVTVLEPTAGNGALLIETNPNAVLANEIDPTRAAALRAQDYTVTESDATKELSPPKKYQRVKANPPFGTVLDDNGQRMEWTVDGLTTHQIDHAIALNALQAMQDDGRAVLIIGGTQAISPNERRAHYSRGEIGAFFKKLYAEYGVIEHFTVNGDLYSKQGAGWPVDVIVIAGRRPSPIQLPNTQPPRILNTWEELKNELSKTDEERIAAGQYDETKDRDELGGSLAGIRDALDSGGRPGGAGASSQPAIEPGSGASGTGAGNPAGSQPGTNPGESLFPPAAGSEGGVGDGSVDGRDSGGRGLPVTSSAPEPAPIFHKKYTPVSEGPSFGIETPANLEAPQRDALEGIQRSVGMPLREYVRQKLGYAESEDLGQYFSAEQIDAIASAIYNIENGGALILGDMAGVGKGRVVAGLIEYAKRHDLVPIFVTKGASLYSAMLGDFHNINRTVNPFFTNGDLNIVHPVSGEEIKTASAGKKRELAAMEREARLPAGYDAVFTTYDQIGKDFDPEESKQSRQRAVDSGGVPMPGQRVKALAALTAQRRTLLLLDESHLGAGSSIQGRRLRTMIARPEVRVYYSSATFAKRPDAMPLYFKTNLRKAAPSAGDLMEVFASGGVVMQQVASQMLAQDGQYIRRERTFDGIPFETRINIETEERDRKLANEYTRGLRGILDMSNRVERAVRSMNAIMARIGKRMNVPTIKMEGADFASQIHHFVNQYLFAIKAEAAAQQAIKAIKEGHVTKDGSVKPHKVIVAVQNTMEGPITDLAASGQPLEFTSLLLRTLEGLRQIKTGGNARSGTATYFTVAREPLPEYKNLSHDDLVDQLVEVVTRTDASGASIRVGVVREKVAMEIFRRLANDQFLAAEDEIKQLELGGMPLSPIDHIRKRASEAGIRTGEITGRTVGIGPDGETYQRTALESSKKGHIATLKEFNDSDLDLMVINASGSTGISAHSDINFQNKAPRMMIVAQANLDINEFVQTLGRIFRSGQVEDPRYQLLQTALPAEKRPAAIMARKMAGLNANTTSNTDSEISQGTKTVDIFNEYGDGVVWTFLRSNPGFTRDLQYPKIMTGPEGVLRPLADILADFEEDGKLARNVAGRAGLLPVEDQEVFWEDVTNRYLAQIAYLDQIGENKLKASAEDLGAEMVDRREYTRGDPTGTSVFDAPSFIETVRVKPRTPPMEPEEVLGLAQTAADGKKVAIASYKKAAQDYTESYLAQRKEKTLGDWSVQEPKERKRLQDRYSEVWAQLQRLGNPVRVATQSGHKLGAIIGFEMDEDHPLTPSKQVFVIANNTLKRIYKIPASQMGERVMDMDPEGFADQYNHEREDKALRMIATGNLIAAAARLQGAGHVTLYTKADGSVETGILLPGNFDPNTINRAPIPNAAEARRLLINGTPLRSNDGKVQLTYDGTSYHLAVPSSKAGGGKYWQDRPLNRTMKDGEMIQRGALMRGEIVSFDAAFDRLVELEVVFSHTPPGAPLHAAEPDIALHAASHAPFINTASPAQRAIVAATTGTLSKSFKQRLTEWWADLKANWKVDVLWAADSFADMKELEKRAVGKVQSAEKSPWKKALMTQNLPSVMKFLVEKGQIEFRNGWFAPKKGTKGLLESFGDILHSPEKLRLWEGYAAAYRAKRLWHETNANGTRKEKNFKSEADIDALLKLKEQYPEFETARQAYAEFNKSVLDAAQAAGLLNPDARATWENADYVPFYRMREVVGDSTAPGKKGGLANQQSGIRQLTGRDAKVAILENILRNTETMIDSAFKNAAMLELVDMVNEHSLPGLEHVPYNRVPFLLSVEEVQATLEREGIDASSIGDDDLDTIIKFWRARAPKGKDLISVMRGGKPEFYRVTDPRLMRDIQAVGPDNFGGLITLAGKFRRLLTETVTLDPVFGVANFMRDSISAWVQSDLPIKPGISSAKGFLKALREDDALMHVWAAGGGLATYHGSNPEIVRAQLLKLARRDIPKDFVGSLLDTPGKMLRFVLKLNRASENATRVAIEEAAMASGASEAEAAFQAMDVMNFSQRGGYRAVRMLVQVLPFFNARVQGLYRLGRGAAENPKTFATRGLMLMGAALALLALNWRDERFWELQEWDRDQYFHFWIGNQHFRIPKPFEVGAIFATAPERIMQALGKDGDGRLLGERFLSMLGDTFAFNPIPQIIRPGVEVWANRDIFKGQPILNTGDQFRLPERQASPWTSSTFKAVAKAMPDSAPDWMRSPKILEHVYRGYVSALGMYAVDAADRMLEVTGKAPTRPERLVDKVPALGKLIHRFAPDDETRTSKFVNEFYELYAELDTVLHKIKDAERSGDALRAAGLRASEQPLLARQESITKAFKELQALRKKQDALRESAVPSSQKLEGMRNLTTEKNRLAKAVAQ